MIDRYIIFGAGVICFAIFVSSPSEQSNGDVPRSFVARSDVSSDSQANSSWYAGGTSLERQSDGHFYANANVDGANVNFLVDTGASVIALTAEDARAAGLFWHEGDIRAIGSGASGTVYGVPASLPIVEVDGIEARNVSAVIIPEGLTISLLGQSFLSEVDTVRISGDQMLLSMD